MPRKSDDHAEPHPERIAKAIARAGLASRREAEAWIAAGRVAVNGKVIDSAALNVTADDRVTVDGAPLPARERTRLFLYHKPRGLVTTNADPEGRPTIFDALPKHLPRLLSVGRLDIGTEGLLLLTNDGGLARVLELPETGWLRRYRVRALGKVAQQELDKLRDGITVDGIHYGPIEATLDHDQGSNIWLTFAIREGKNREVRNVLGHLGLQVNRLIRVSFGPFALRDLAEGAVEEVRTRVLREQLGERVIAEAKCDFSAPIVERDAKDEAREPRRDAREWGRREDRPRRERDARGRREDRPRHERDGRGRKDHLRGGDGRGDRHNLGERGRDHRREQREEKPGRPRRGNAWRQEDAPLRRHYRGGRDESGAERDEPTGQKRAGLLTDRMGRRVLVERFGEKKPEREERKQSRFGSRPDKGHARKGDARKGDVRQGEARRGRARRPDRSGGPRPSRPRER
ncbi:MAG TPA: pseudouridine synthase [Xanthobacteraceae bacterium]|nr:pseudouridine synthase [Xanthobacteraceae bacterium]